MRTFVCVKKCFHRNRLWLPGETLEADGGAIVPPFFKPGKDSEAEAVKAELKKDKAQRAEKPVALSELQKQDKALDSMFD
jgi:hypothetical protein